ncbi:amidohydrolase family protein [Rhodohalobacter mucosus]|nr:amidohydrolase family protein [Rhodohalobacter mucosus]
MTKQYLIAFLLIASCTVFLFIPSISSAQNLIIRGGWIVHPESAEVIPNPDILIQNGDIAAIQRTTFDDDAKILALDPNDHILPGLIDLHAHLKMEYRGITRDDTTATPKMLLANGVTTIFTAGDVEPEKVLQFKKNVNAGNSYGPRILNSGPYFGRANPDWNPEYTRGDIYRIVDEWAERGVGGFKAKTISPVNLKHLIDRAHHHNITVTAHLNSGWNNTVRSDEAISMGIDRVEHFLGGSALPDSVHAYDGLEQLDPDDPEFDKIIDIFIENDVFFSATMGTFGAWSGSSDPAFEKWVDETVYLTPFTKQLFEKFEEPDTEGTIAAVYGIKKELIKDYYDRGGMIVLATDRPLYLDSSLGPHFNGFFVHREMEILADAGIPNADVLTIATLNGARAMGLDHQIGSIEPGKIAYLMIIDGNPIEDIRRTRTVHTVIKEGNIFNSGYLLNLAEGKLGPQSDEKWMEDK